MSTTLSSLLIPYGYGLVFILILLESAGLPLPGETLLVLAAALASSGRLSIAGVIISAVLGAILGDMGGYWIGRRGGAVLLKRILGKNYEGHISKGRVFFNRYGAGAVFLARFVPVVRVVAANLAGMTEMPFSTFTRFNVAGGVAWAVTMGSLGYFFGNNLPYLETILRRLGIGVFLAIALIATAVWAGRKMSIHETEFYVWKERIILSLGIRKFQLRFVHWLHTHHRGLAFTLTSGFLLASFSGWMFGALAEDVLSHDSLTLYDTGVSRWLLGLVTEDGSQFFYLVTLLGSTSVILTGSLLLGGWLVWRKKNLQGSVLALSVGGGILLNLLLKNIFLRPRPNFPNAFYHESSYSFPSGHAMFSVLFFGMAAYLIASQNFSWKGKVYLAVSAFTISLLIGFSRIFLGVHYLTDVLGGWSAGVVWLTVCITLLEAVQLSRSKASSL